MAKMGRPIKELDFEKLEMFLQFNPSLEDTCAMFQIGETTLLDKITDRYGLTFRELRHQKRVPAKYDLIQTARQMAKKGNTAMMIFLLKNQCGYSDMGMPDDTDDIEGLDFVS